MHLCFTRNLNICQKLYFVFKNFGFKDNRTDLEIDPFKLEFGRVQNYWFYDLPIGYQF